MTPEERKRLFRLHRNDSFITEVGSEDDRWLRELEERGLVKLYDAMFTKHYWSLTTQGQCEMGLI